MSTFICYVSHLQIQAVVALEILITKVRKLYKIVPPLLYVCSLYVALRKQPLIENIRN